MATILIGITILTTLLFETIGGKEKYLILKGGLKSHEHRYRTGRKKVKNINDEVHVELIGLVKNMENIMR